MATYRVVMVRHGESEWNKENKFCGWFDAELSEKGNIDLSSNNLLHLAFNVNFFCIYLQVLGKPKLLAKL